MSFFFKSSAAISKSRTAPSRSNTGGRRRRSRRRVAKSTNRRRGSRLPPHSGDSKAVLRRLQALKELIPPIRNFAVGGDVPPTQPRPEAADADRIFEDAAGYIVRLRMQVEILRRLVDLYGVEEGTG